MKKISFNLVLVLVLTGLVSACGGGDSTTTESTTKAAPVEIYKPKAKANPLGIGPIKAEVVLGEFNPTLAAEGEAVFTQMCTACHKLDKKHVGPALGEVLTRRNAAWVMNMILNPDVMVKEDPVAKKLFAEYLSPMANQNLTEDQARAVVEYIRQYDMDK
jgi:cytochrome c